MHVVTRWGEMCAGCNEVHGFAMEMRPSFWAADDADPPGERCTVCAQAGENDLMKWGTGRFHVEHDPARGIFGHAPMQE